MEREGDRRREKERLREGDGKRVGERMTREGLRLLQIIKEPTLMKHLRDVHDRWPAFEIVQRHYALTLVSRESV